MNLNARKCPDSTAALRIPSFQEDAIIKFQQSSIIITSTSKRIAQMTVNAFVVVCLPVHCGRKQSMLVGTRRTGCWLLRNMDGDIVFFFWVGVKISAFSTSAGRIFIPRCCCLQLVPWDRHCRVPNKDRFHSKLTSMARWRSRSHFQNGFQDSSRNCWTISSHQQQVLPNRAIPVPRCLGHERNANGQGRRKILI